MPMMVAAGAGSLGNLYVLWRIRSLRARGSSQWRARPVSAEQRRSEWLQMSLAIVTLALVLAEWLTHRIVHDVP